MRLSNEIYLLSLDRSKFGDPRMAAFIKEPGRAVLTIPKGIYGPNRKNTDDVLVVTAYVSPRGAASRTSRSTR